ncbi:16108_t:CDS:10 [Entrophospora sp. SA101]|nr:16108_t:CDS:10 [Entrophospora sp. SA101]
MTKTPQELEKETNKNFILNNLDKYIVDGHGIFYHTELGLGDDYYCIGSELVKDYEEVKEKVIEKKQLAQLTNKEQITALVQAINHQIEQRLKELKQSQKQTNNNQPFSLTVANFPKSIKNNINQFNDEKTRFLVGTISNIFQIKDGIPDNFNYANLLPEKLRSLLGKIELSKSQFVIGGLLLVLVYALVYYWNSLAEEELRIRGGHYTKNLVLDKFRCLPLEEKEARKDEVNNLIEKDAGEIGYDWEHLPNHTFHSKILRNEKRYKERLSVESAVINKERNNATLVESSGLTSQYSAKQKKVTQANEKLLLNFNHTKSLNRTIPNNWLMESFPFLLLALSGGSFEGVILMAFWEIFEYADYTSSRERINSFLALPEKNDNLTQPKLPPNIAITALRLENISFRYGRQKEWLLKNYNRTFSPGKVNYLLGKNGTGKSTVLYLCLEEGSTGQKQLVNINQTLEQKNQAQIFFFDEADNALDQDNQKQLQEKIKERFKTTPLTLIYKLFRTKKIKVNGENIRYYHQRLKVGEEINIYDGSLKVAQPSISLKPENSELNPKIIYEDQNLIIVLKEHGYLMPELDKAVQHYLYQQNPQLYQELSQKYFSFTATHRLDKLTKGLIIYPKNPTAKRILHNAISDKEKIIKKYLALCEKLPKKALPNYISGSIKDCALEIKEIDRENNQLLLEITLHTGRKHQIRSILSYWDCPIIGDKKYGTEARKILGVSENATPQEIKKARDGLARKHHTDKGGSNEEIQKINVAYEVLTKGGGDSSDIDEDAI